MAKFAMPTNGILGIFFAVLSISMMVAGIALMATYNKAPSYVAFLLVSLGVVIIFFALWLIPYAVKRFGVRDTVGPVAAVPIIV